MIFAVVTRSNGGVIHSCRNLHHIAGVVHAATNRCCYVNGVKVLHRGQLAHDGVTGPGKGRDVSAVVVGHHTHGKF